MATIEQEQGDVTRLLDGILKLFNAPASTPEDGSPDTFNDLPPHLLSLADSHPHDALDFIHGQFYSVRFDRLPEKWLRGYEEVSWRLARQVFVEAVGLDGDERGVADEGSGDDDVSMGWVDEVVRILDKAIIMSGAKRRIDGINAIMSLISDFLVIRAVAEVIKHDREDSVDERSPKRRRVAIRGERTTELDVPDSWPVVQLRSPPIKKPIGHLVQPSLHRFQQHIDSSTVPRDGPEPVVLAETIQHWPALDPGLPERRWNNPSNLMRKTLGGRRLAPIETGRSYMDEDFGQKIMTIGEFVRTYMLSPNDGSNRKTAYLAQHDLLRQIPQLRKDVAIPDHCYADATIPEGQQQEDQTEPLLNAWFGPAGTISPLHRDNYHNIFAQVVGHKYVRLYAPSQLENIYPADKDAGGNDISNTSAIDVGTAMKVFEGWHWQENEETKCENEGAGVDSGKSYLHRFVKFKDAKYVETVLGPGDCLYVPYGWWHYVRSLSTSFSVSFWWR